MQCTRCHELFGDFAKCSWCGVARDRPVRRCRRTNKIGGKHGRNSGKVSNAKKK